MSPTRKNDRGQMPAGGLIIVVGMTSEARIVEDRGRVLVGTRDLAAMLREPSAGVISFGVCGGLDPALRVGDLIIADGVTGGGRRIATHPAWNRALRAALPEAWQGDIVSGHAIVGSAAAKRALRRDCGAAGVDMESHDVALAASSAGLPFAVVRAVSDPATRALPLAAQAGFKTGPTADGEPDIGAVLRALARRPWELPALVRTALDATGTMRSLRNATRALAPPPS